MARTKYDWEKQIEVSNLTLPTSTSLLTPTEYYRKRADLIEQVIGSKISIEYTGEHVNYIQRLKENGDYAITIAKPQVKGIPTKTAIYHELSHALHETFLSGVIDYVNDLGRTDGLDLLEAVYKDSGIPRINTEHVQCNIKIAKGYKGTKPKGKWVKTDHVVKDEYGREVKCIMCDTCGELSIEWIDWEIENYMEGAVVEMLRAQYHDTTNVLEDQRIESLTSMLWLATRGMFAKARKACGNVLVSQKDKIDLTNPTNMMLAERFYQPQICTDNRLVKAVHLVEGASSESTVIVFRTNVRIPVLEWMQEQICELLAIRLELSTVARTLGAIGSGTTQKDKEMQKEIDKIRDKLDKALAKQREFVRRKHHSSKEIQEEIRELQQLEGRLKNKNYDREQSRADQKELSKRRETSLEELWESIKEQGKNRGDVSIQTTLTHEVETEATQKEKERVAIDIKGLTLEKMGERELLHELDYSKSKGKAIVKKLQEQFGISTPSLTPSHIKLVDRTEEEYEVDNGIVTSLERILRKIKERESNALTDIGEEIDIDGYINAKTTGNGECFIGSKRDNGLCLMITIDGSGSMKHNDNIDKVRTLVSSIFTVAKNNPEIEIHANIWSSNSMGNVGLTEIESLSDCKKISLSVDTGNVFGSYYETPTHIALDYSAKKLSKMKARNKMLIVLTDGLPQYSKDNYRMQDRMIVKSCKKALRKSLEICPNILAINIEKRKYPDGVLRSIFGKRFITFGGMANASLFIQTQLRRKLIEVYRT